MGIRKLPKVTTGIAELIDKLGADIAVSLDDYERLSPKQLKRERVGVELDYVAAEEERGGAECVLPHWAMYDGEHRSSAVTCLWDRPTGRHARHRGYMRRVLETAGVYEDETTHVWAFPYEVDYAPLPSDVAAYRQLTMDALKASNSRYVLLIGSIAVNMWRPFKMKDVLGRMFVWQNRWMVWAVVNPITVLIDPAMQADWKRNLYAFCNVMREDAGLELLSGTCIEEGCDDALWLYDADGVPWCKKHHGKGVTKTENQREKERKMANKMMQGGLEL